MKIKYQLILIGHSNPLTNQIIDSIGERMTDLGMGKENLSIIDAENFVRDYKGNSPAVAVYFGSDNRNFPNIDILERLISDSTIVIPIVNDLNHFSAKVPDQLYPINGFELRNENSVEALVGRIMEGLGLLRLSRRLFISYKRNESRGVAIQLFEKLEEAGFDVFLDTHSIRQGDIFQDELWHRLVDTDVVVLLNTKGFLESEWTKEELAKASAKSIGILQLIWPNHTAEPSSTLSIQLPLKEAEFENGKFNSPKAELTDGIIATIVNQVESLRARSLGARQDNIINEFMKAASAASIPTHLQPERFITVDISSDKQVIVIPTIGVPHAFTYNQSEDLIKTIKEHNTKEVFILYDHINIREKWLKHLDWLDGYLPVSSIKLLDADKWLQKKIA
jgi:hypothetical protein